MIMQHILTCDSIKEILCINTYSKGEKQWNKEKGNAFLLKSDTVVEESMFFCVDAKLKMPYQRFLICLIFMSAFLILLKLNNNYTAFLYVLSGVSTSIDS